jgi:predicted phosphodiesterase
MNFQVYSDLHVDFHKDMGKSLIGSLPVLSDTLVLAGDLCEGYGVEYILPLFCQKWKRVIYVPGNHEYYSTGIERFHRILEGLKIPNLHVLNKGLVEVGGQRFLGATLWFKDQPDNVFHENRMGDFKHISNLKPWVYQENRDAIRFFHDNLKAGDVMVTHHMSHPVFQHPKWRGDSLSRFFLCDLSNFISYTEPSVVVCGHTHDPTDTVLGNTRFVCNPFGYLGSGEGKLFNPGLVVELP